jgi:hypothetical protein
MDPDEEKIDRAVLALLYLGVDRFAAFTPVTCQRAFGASSARSRPGKRSWTFRAPRAFARARREGSGSRDV